jgi:hypothetical protein
LLTSLCLCLACREYVTTFHHASSLTLCLCLACSRYVTAFFHHASSSLTSLPHLTRSPAVAPDVAARRYVTAFSAMPCC